MNGKEIVKYFYEVVVSENLLDELPKYISNACVQKVGKSETFIGIEGIDIGNMKENWKISITHNTKIHKNMKKAHPFVLYMVGGLFSYS